MNRTEELKQMMIEQFDKAIDECANRDCSDDEHKHDVFIDDIAAKRLFELLKRIPKDAKWHYYTNDEGKPRWKCTECGKLCRRRPTDKLYCSRCGSKMSFEC